MGVDALPDRHFVVCHSQNRYDLREISADVAASVISYGVVSMDHACQGGECWHFYFINARFVHPLEREAALTELVPMVHAVQRESSEK
jgi:hypothetical protein